MTAPVVLVGARKLDEPDDDEGPLLAALAAAGIPAVARAWDDPGVAWGEARAALLRATWNYYLQPEAFLDWAARCASVTALWNPLPVVRWNIHKRYLLDLAAAGVPVVPTRIVPRGSPARIEELAGDWDEVVIKPAISAASFCTLRVGRGELARGQAHLDAALVERDMMVQPYFRSVESHGERAVVWIDGAFTHEVRKRPRWAGEAESTLATGEVGAPEREVAARALAAAPAPLLYARVDLARDDRGRPHVMELELMEPSLFFPANPAAAHRLAAAVARL